MELVSCFGLRVPCTQKTGSILARKVHCCAIPEYSRRSGNYQPSSWDYGSLESLTTDFLDWEPKYEIAKQEVRRLMINKDTEPAKRLQLIDEIQRLGVAYVFYAEIKEVLQSVSKLKNAFKEDVLSMSLLFRLLRENGFQVSQDIFSNFLDDTGTFKPSIQNDTKGLLSLYDASFLAFEEEDLLEKAQAFSLQQLTKVKPTLDPQQKVNVEQTLELPLHWRAPRLEARWFIDQYSADKNMEPKLLQFAKLDFDMVQTVHRSELARISRWWRKTALDKKLSFARNRLVECFFYATGIVPELQWGACREIITKVAILIVFLDDVYDIYGTMDELVLFTDAIGKWNLDAAQNLPEYMRHLYATILSTSNEFSQHILKVEGWDPLSWQKTMWHDLCKAFLTEAKWHHSGTIPSLNEYLENGWVSASGSVLLHHAFPLRGEKATAQALCKQQNYTSLVRSCSMIFRLCNDTATHSVEAARGDAPSSIACYMREYDANENDARLAVHKLTSNVWKMINKDAFGSSTNHLPRSFLNAAMNLARISHCTYQQCDGISTPNDEKKKLIKSLFFEPVQLKQH